MAKAVKQSKKISTNAALEQLLGRKAAKRLRKLATQIAAEDSKSKRRNTKRKTNN